MSDQLVVNANHNGLAYPIITARHINQTAWLVDALLREHAHTETWFTIEGQPRRWMRTGYHGTYGAALFVDETAAPNDWAWAALNPEPITGPPTIYYDQPAETIFPSACVLPLGLLREVILEWVQTGDRPISVDWIPVNGLSWELTEDGGVHVPQRPRTAL
ncbi:Imm1 family immunity protein [Actinokineospora sp.]|uniref:Imm1 family immunity protein n=1 Tax=Actinokineospora sp. TaxID=1872133 RepID=UPI004038415B